MKKRVFSLKRRLLYFCFFMIGCLFLLSIFVMATDQIYLTKEQRLLEKQRLFAMCFNELEDANRTVYMYAQNASEENRSICETAKNGMISSITELREMLQSPLILDCYYMMKRYERQVERLFEITERGDTVSQRLEQYGEIDRQAVLIRELHQNYFEVLENDREQVQRQLDRWNVRKTATVAAAAMVILIGSIFFVLRFAQKLLGPIEHLTAEAREVQQKICPHHTFLPVEEKDETQVLVVTFRQMIETIEQQIQELREKAVLEQKLKKEEISKLEMQAKLDRAQLKMLQSRVNPHFLFNVLNLIGEFAFLENAEQTEDVIIRTRDYLRYSLVNLDKVVTMKKELDHVRDYLMIQKLRFGRRLEFEVNAEKGCEDAVMPAMILQPLAENSMIHGIGPLRRGGTIKIFVRKERQQIECTVEDDGCGMSGECLEEIRRRMDQGASYDDTQGIGLVNVAERMRIYFSGELDVEMESVPDVQTKVVFRFPYQKKEKGDEIDVQDFIGG